MQASERLYYFLQTLQDAAELLAGAEGSAAQQEAAAELQVLLIRCAWQAISCVGHSTCQAGSAVRNAALRPGWRLLTPAGVQLGWQRCGC